MKNLLLLSMLRLFLLLIVSPLLVTSQVHIDYKNLALEGGGIRGLAYTGAFQVLEEKGILQKIERVAGTSSGAIIGVLICLGYSSHEVDSVFRSLPIQEFNDGKNIFGIIHRLKKEYGIFRGEKFDKWIGALIKNKTGNPDATFAQLHQWHTSNVSFKDFYCTGTNITKQQLQVFSWQLTPVMKLRTAVHISGCIPVYYKPVALDSIWKQVPVKKNKGKFDLYVDGGMINNFPINMFDTCLDGGDPFNCSNIKYNFETLGLKLERPEQIERFNQGNTDIAPHPTSTLNDYTLALINLLQETLSRKTVGLVNEKNRTIFISYGNVFGKIRKVNPEEKKELFDNGYQAAEIYLQQHGH
ncbi:MAG: patatin-like phospholipase family protein [Ginsengibacter sp.]